MEKYNHDEDEMDKGVFTSVVDLAKAFEEVQLKVAWAWTMHFVFPAANSSGALRTLAASAVGAL